MQRFFDTVSYNDPEYPGPDKVLANPYMFARVAQEHMRLHGSTPEHFAQIGVKNHQHSANNPYSQFRDVYTLEQVMASPVAHGILTRLQCSPTSSGAAAAIVCSPQFAAERGLLSRR
jgi:acetyl-CoA acetyltransferase